MDAAVAAAAALTVVEPTSHGLGSDAFAIIWSEKDQKLFGLNSSGRSPMLASIEQVKKDVPGTGNSMPKRGWAPVTVPGAVKAWAAVNSRFGKLSLEQDLAPAVQYAEDGRTETAFTREILPAGSMRRAGSSEDICGKLGACHTVV